MVNCVKRLATAAVLVGLMVLASCGKYNYNKPEDEDKMRAQPEIYGEVNGPAKHTKNTYPTNPAAAERSNKIKTLLYSDRERTGVSPDTSNVTAPDTAKAYNAAAGTGSAKAAAGEKTQDLAK
jgi:hypothetical protein